MAFAFRCNNCGRLVSSADAGERALPAACPSCGSGVAFDPRTGLKSYDDANWQVLADLPGDELAALAADHGMKVVELIESHTPAMTDLDLNGVEAREPRSIAVEAVEGLSMEDLA